MAKKSSPKASAKPSEEASPAAGGSAKAGPAKSAPAKAVAAKPATPTKKTPAPAKAAAAPAPTPAPKAAAKATKPVTPASAPMPAPATPAPAKAMKKPAAKATVAAPPAPAAPAAAKKPAVKAAVATPPAPVAVEKPKAAESPKPPEKPKAEKAAKPVPVEKVVKAPRVSASSDAAWDDELEMAAQPVRRPPPRPAEPAPATEAAAPAAPVKHAPMPPRRADGTITLAHSPDADDAFMFYALANGKVDTETRKYEHILSDIQSLNEHAKKGTYDVTAISFHAYPYVQHNYGLLTCGASFGDGYGPMLVAKSPIRANEVDGMTVALPGALTTATLVTKLWFGRSHIEVKQVPFDKVTDAVKSGLVRAGVLIHEGQLTWKEMGLVRVVDFGQWWGEQTEGLPLPLGGNGVRRDIEKPLVTKIALDIKRSIAYALGHREEALAYAMKFGRNLSKEKADKFVGMYVNDLTLDYGERGRQAVKHLLDLAFKAGLLSAPCEPDFLA